jgi:hypothetical protein
LPSSCGGGWVVVVVVVVVIVVGEGVREQRCWVMEWGGQKWAGGLLLLLWVRD